MKFDPNASPPCFRSDAETIAKDTRVRMQLVGCRIEANDMVSFSTFSLLFRADWQFAIGTVKKDYLGQIPE